MTAERCEFSDLIVAQCACIQLHRPDVTDSMLDGELDFTPGRGVELDQLAFEPTSRLFEAAFPGECASCEGAIRPGQMIARTSDGSYVCRGCS